MKIAFTACGNSWNEKVDIRFGRAKGIFIIDTENEETIYIDNTVNASAAEGAGTDVASLIIEQGIEILITGKVGPNAARILKESNVTIFGGIGYGSIREAYEHYKKGLLVEQPLS